MSPVGTSRGSVKPAQRGVEQLTGRSPDRNTPTPPRADAGDLSLVQPPRPHSPTDRGGPRWRSVSTGAAVLGEASVTPLVELPGLGREEDAPGGGGEQG